jgi:hypothetical protein
MFHKTTSKKFIAPRRQASKGPTLPIFLFMSKLGVLCAFAQDIFADSVIQIQPKISNTFG